MSIGAGEAILKQLQGQSKKKDVFMNRETRKEKGNFTIPYGRALGALMPVLGYVIFETTTGNLMSITFARMFINLAFYYLIYGLVYLVVNRFRAAMMGTTIVLYILAAVDYYVLQFKGSPLLLPQDLMAWRTAAAVVSNYHITLSRPVVLGAVLLLLVLFLLWHTDVEKMNLKKRGIFAGSYAVLAAAWLIAFYQYDVKLPLADIDDDIFWWSLEGSYQDFGYATSTAILIKSMVFEKPEGYSVEAATEAGEEAVFESTPVSETTPENLIVIMNESLSDMRVIRNFTTNEEFFPFISSLEENTIKSHLYVQVFGGGTSNTEYETLTGHSITFLPYVISAYQAYCKPAEYGMATTLKAQGYTTVAMHPNSSANWNRKTVYEDMGFDEFISQSHYGDVEKLRNYVSDKGNYDRLISRYEEKTPGEKLFIFNVTMQNHGGYEESFPEFQEEIEATGDVAGYPQANRYLSLMKKSDEAFEYLIDYFSQVEEPTMIVMFGDHQAAVETEFYEKLYGKSLKELTPEEADKQYVTPLIIWTNYEMEKPELDRISSNYLGAEILNLANLELTDYDRLLLEAREEIPVFGKNGYYLSDGTYVTWSKNVEKPELMRRYQILEYNAVADRNNRVDRLFTLMP